MIPGMKYIHHLVIGQDGRYRVETTGQRFTDDIDIGDDRLVVTGEHLAGASQAGLNFIGD